MAFNNTRTILLHGPRGLEWYVPTPARPPHETDKRHPMEVFRDTQFWATPFPPTQPPVLGALATPGWEKRWSWTYIEATNTTNGMTRHFLRRNPDGVLLLREHLIGQTYRVLVNAENGVLPAQPNSDFPEPTPSRPLMSLHCRTDTNDKGEAIEHYYIAYQLRNGAPELPLKVAANKHALQKRDGSWCLLPKTETEVPERWQPKPSATTKDSLKENGAQKPILELLVESTPAVVKDALKGTAAAVTSTWDTCTKGVIKLWESCRSALTSEAEEKTQAPSHQISEEKKATIVMTTNSGNGACTEVSRTQASRSGNSPNYPLTQLPTYPMHLPNYPIQPTGPTPKTASAWSWTAIQMNDSNKTIHCLRCSPQGRLLFKRKLLDHIFTIYRSNVDCTIPAEPSVADMHEALSLTHVQIAPEHYAVVEFSHGQPQLPERVAREYDLHKNPDGSWSTIEKPKNQNNNGDKNENKNKNVAQKPALEANAEGPSAVVKDVRVNQPAKSNPNSGNVSTAKVSRSDSPGNSSNYPITNLPNYPIPSPTYPILEDLEKLISNHLVCSPAQRTVLALWILHTYVSPAMTVTPYLNIHSPVEESGKTTCLAILRALCAQPWWAGGTSPSAFKRRLAVEANTVLLDNWHTLFRSSDKHQMTGFLLNGCDFVPDFCAHLERQTHKLDVCRVSPKAFAGSESLPPALARRSIPIVLHRRRPAEKVVPVPSLMLSPKTAKITSAMKAWAKDHKEAITQAHAKCDTQLMLGLTPHQQESARVLMAVAATIGEDWPVKAYDALMEIFADYNEGQVSPTQLLSDIRDAFLHHGNPERLFTNELLTFLHDLDHRTYDQWTKQGDPMTPHALARILDKHFEIHPRTLRRKKEGGKEGRLKGYQRSDFQEAWERYLPSLEAKGKMAEEPEQKLEMPRSAADRFKPAAKSQELGASSFVSPNKIALCHDVTLKNSTTKTPPRKSQISAMSQFKSGCQKALKKLVAKAIGLITIL